MSQLMGVFIVGELSRDMRLIQANAAKGIVVEGLRRARTHGGWKPLIVIEVIDRTVVVIDHD